MKPTVILIGVIVILSLAAPAAMGGGGGSDDGSDQEIGDTDLQTPQRTYDEVYQLLVRAWSFAGNAPVETPVAPSNGAPSAPGLPGEPDLPAMPEAPGGGGAPDAPGGNGVPTPADHLPCSDLANSLKPCEEESSGGSQDDAAPAAPEQTEPHLPELPEGEEPTKQIEQVTEETGQQRARSEGLLTVLLGPVQAAANAASAGAKTVVSTTLTTAGFVTNEAAQQVSRHAAQTLDLAQGLLERVLEPIFGSGNQAAMGNAGGALAANAAQTTSTDSPVGMVTLGLIAVGSLGLIAAAFALGRKLLGLGGIALLSRIPSKDIMKSDTRATIFDIVSNDPGVSLNEIVERLGLSRNAVAYHLAVFESEKTVVSVKDGKYRRYFVNGGKYVNGAKDVVSTIKNDVTLNVIRYILDHPGAMQKEVCGAVGTSPSATNWHIHRLEKVGLVEKEKVANTVRYSPGPSFAKYNLGEFGLEAPVSTA